MMNIDPKAHRSLRVEMEVVTALLREVDLADIERYEVPLAKDRPSEAIVLIATIVQDV